MIPDLNVATNFLDHLRPNGPWVVVAIYPNAPTPVVRTFTRPEDVGTFITTHNKQAGIYYSLNPTKTALTKKATKADTLKTKRPRKRQKHVTLPRLKH